MCNEVNEEGCIPASGSVADENAMCMQVQTAAGVRYKPQKRFWYFGLANVLRDRMFSDPTWCRLRGTGRDDPDQPYDYWHSPEFQRVNAASGGKLTEEGTSASVYDLGIDWGQPFGWKQHSSGYIALRCGNPAPACVPL